MKKILLLFISFVFTIYCVNSAFAQEKYSKIRIKLTEGDINKIAQAGIPLDFGVSIKNNELTGEFSSSDLKKLQNAGFRYKILTDDMSKFYADRCKKKANLVRSEKTPVNFNLGTMGGYLILDEILAELDEMKTLYPDLITEKSGIEKNFLTYEGDSIYFVKISDNPDADELEPEVLYTALVHAREPAGMMQIIYYMWYLLENYDSNPEIKYLVDNTEIYFIPCANPGGYEYNRQTDPTGGGMWRKNRRDNGSGLFGVDLNRNFGFNWGYDNSGSSPDASDETYRGPSAFSEPETQMLKNFTESREFVIANNHHTYSNLLLYPFGYDELYTPDQDIFAAYAGMMTKANGYSVGTAWELLYPVNGDTNDWMYGEQISKNKIIAFTAESGDSNDGFWPEQDRILPICEGNLDMNLYLTRFATDYAEIFDKTFSIIPADGYIKFDVKRFGLSGMGNYTVSLSSDDDIFENVGENKQVELTNVLDLVSDSIQYTLKSSIANGTEINLKLTLHFEAFDQVLNLTKQVGNVEILVSDSCNTTTGWTTNQWNTSDLFFVSPDYSITDSPSGDYADDETNSITSQSFDLTETSFALLSFAAMWDIENNWDCVTFSVSTDNGSSWTPLQGLFTNPGAGQGQQGNGVPLYDGLQSSWVNEEIDLEPYLGNTVKFKFELQSDGSVTGDGFYFDDFAIITLTDAASSLSEKKSTNIRIYPNPSAGDFTIDFGQNSENKIVSINDISGKIVFEKEINQAQISGIRLNKGVYFIVVKDNTGNKNIQKLIIR